MSAPMTTDPLPRVPTRTDARLRCMCGGTMIIATVETIPHRLDAMRHTYDCSDCGASASFAVAKKAAPGLNPAAAAPR